MRTYYKRLEKPQRFIVPHFLFLLLAGDTRPIRPLDLVLKYIRIPGISLRDNDADLLSLGICSPPAATNFARGRILDVLVLNNREDC